MRAVLEVDRILGPGEATIQALPPFAQAAPYVSGIALTPAGLPYIVLDPAALLRTGAFTPARLAHAAASVKKLPILVIDDSLTTRMLEQSILETEGYEVELAVSAEMGLDMARRKPYALFLCDVEMPGMSGFDFVATVTADPALAATPAILVTSLDSPESRERGRQAGAVFYIVKGEFNQQLYLDRIRSLVGGAA